MPPDGSSAISPPTNPFRRKHDQAADAASDDLGRDTAVVGEYLGSSRGVGYLILQAEGTFDINTVFAGILVLTAFALALDAAVGSVERRLMTWQPRASETEKA